MPFQVKLDQAVRRWEAEEENARRLSVRVQVLSTVTLGFFGVVFVQTGALATAARPEQLPRFQEPVLVLGVAGLLAILAAAAVLFDLLRRKDRARRPASHDLSLPVHLQEELDREMLLRLKDRVSPDDDMSGLTALYKYQAALAIESAASHLHNRNALEHQRIGRAQLLLCIGLLCLTLALGLRLAATIYS